ncbi:MAG TPA: NUDIX hydrolase, partial [Treponemataceae bacterium]|nr:NUDIX hydrolase [Treponemataceae bacterium]
MTDKTVRWEPLKSTSVFSTRVFDIHEILSRSPDNQDHTFYSLKASDWVIVVPVIHSPDGEDEFLMVRQWRHGVAEESLEFPGGVMNPGEKPEEAALREMLEETGFTAKKIYHGATVSPNPAIMSNHCHFFIAEDLQDTRETHLDEDEYVTVERIPVQTVQERMG